MVNFNIGKNGSLILTSPTEKNTPKKFNLSNDFSISDITMSDSSTASVDGVTDHIGEGLRLLIRQSNVPIWFPANYLKSLMVLIISNISKLINVGNLHPITVGKLFTKNYEDVVSIVPVGSQRLKVVFDSIKNTNMCILSPFRS